MVEMMQKRLDLLAACVDLLEAHETGLRAEMRYRPQTDVLATPSAQAAVMGDPAYYLEVLHASGPVSALDVNGGAPEAARDTFAVSLFYQMRDADQYEQSSQAAWDEMVYSTDADAPGFLVGLMRTLDVGAGDDRCTLADPADVRDDVVPLSTAKRTLAHLLTFKIDVEG